MPDANTAQVLRATAATLLAEADRLDKLAAPPAPPPPAPAPPTPPPKTFRVVPSDTSKWKLGQPTKVRVESTGYASFTVIECGGDEPKHTWRKTRLPVPATGAATDLDFTPTEVGGFIKVCPDADVTKSLDSERVPASAAPPTPVPAQPVSGGAAPPPVSAGGSVSARLAQALAFKRSQVMIANLERERFVTQYRIDAQLMDYWRDVGITGARAFNPFKRTGVKQPDGSFRNFWDYQLNVFPTKDQFARFFPKMHVLVDNKFGVLFDCLDMTGPVDLVGDNRARYEAWLDQAAQWIAAEGFDPLYFVPGAVNEWEHSTNAAQHEVRESFWRIMRARLPNHLLGMAPSNWGHPKNYFGNELGAHSFGPYNPVCDDGTIHFWHAYERWKTPEWTKAQALMNAWSAAHGGRVVMCGEIGAGGLYDGKDAKGGGAGSWVEFMAWQHAAIAESVPALWAITEGDWRLSRGFNDARFWNGSLGYDPQIEQQVRLGVAACRAARGV